MSTPLHDPNTDVSTCPECGEPLQATVKVYLKNVRVDADDPRHVRAYEVAFTGEETDTNPLGMSINLDEADEIDIYCPNDHPYPSA